MHAGLRAASVRESRLASVQTPAEHGFRHVSGEALGLAPERKFDLPALAIEALPALFEDTVRRVARLCHHLGLDLGRFGANAIALLAGHLVHLGQLLLVAAQELTGLFLHGPSRVTCALGAPLA